MKTYFNQLKAILFAVCLTLLICLPAFGQTNETEVPRAELFGGYSYAGSDTHGWNGSVAVNANKWFGIVGDFSGQYTNTREANFREKIRTHSALVGPQFSIRKNKRVTPFARALFGMAFIDTNATEAGQTFLFNDKSFSMAFGGGLDVRVNKNVAIRAFQADYVRTKFFGETQNKGRISFGVVIRFGEK
ncbi:MAG: porin family protein [Acidobacteriota bacterium]|nr:porin family protein [Acidobacteriota bacterium]